MLERIRTQVGTAGLIVAIVALVAALGGGAYAATGGSSGGKATASAKQAKQGKQGKPGKIGPAGPQGPAGPAGPAGSAGPKGDTGATGSNGANGTSVTGTPVAAGQEGCAAGGVKYTSASGGNVVCNGKNGTNGTTGFTSTLPPGKTETGAWAFGQVTAAAAPLGGVALRVPISFNIPLGNDLTEGKVHYLNPGETSDTCHGSSAAPSADPGNLCVYAFSLEHADPFLIVKAGVEEIGASTAGAVIWFREIQDGAQGTGTWAVTEEE